MSVLRVLEGPPRGPVALPPALLALVALALALALAGCPANDTLLRPEEPGGAAAAPDPQPPTAAFTPSRPDPVVGGALIFDGRASTDPDGRIATFTWDFGDGASASGAVVDHVFAIPGTFTVTLAVTDDQGLAATSTLDLIVVAPAGQPPRAEIGFAPAAPVRGAAVSFDGTASADPDGAIASFAWDFGDGASATGPVAAHAYQSAGIFPVVLTVTDDDGERASAVAVVVVTDPASRPPLATFASAPANPLRGSAIAFDGSASSDPDGGALADFAWSFGDGTAAAGAVVGHAFAQAGAFAVTLTVTDAAGDTASATRVVVVAEPEGLPPLPAFAVTPSEPTRGASAVFDARASLDADGEVVDFAWSFGDGSSATGAVVPHAFAAAGAFPVTLTVTDDDGQAASLARGVLVRAPAGAPPVPTFAVDPATPAAGLSATFDGTASLDPDGQVVDFAWTFGDGATGAGAVVAHAYAAPGTYAVTLAVTDDAGTSASATANVLVLGPEMVALAIAPAGARLAAADATLQLRVDGIFSNGDQVDLTAASTGTTYASSNPFVAEVEADGLVRAIANGETTITATSAGRAATSTITVEVGVDLLALGVEPDAVTLVGAGTTTQLAVEGVFSDGSIRDLTASATGTTYATSDAALATISPDGLVTALGAGTCEVAASSEGRTAIARVTVLVPGGSGFIRGEVFDDARGQPLAGALVTLVRDGGGAVGASSPLVAATGPGGSTSGAASSPAGSSMTTGADGRFALPGRAGPALVRIEAPGFTTVERAGDIRAGGATTVLDARAAPLDPRTTRVGAITGGQAADRAGTARLVLAPGSLAADADLRVTALSSQALPNQLPPGWSPAAAARIDLAPAAPAFGSGADLRLAGPAGLPPGAALPSAFYDEVAHAWRAGPPASVSADGALLVVAVDRPATWAVLVPDDAPLAPPATSPGGLLAGAPQGALPADAFADGVVEPPAAPPAPDVRARGSIVVGSASAPLASGTVIEVEVREQFDLFGGARVVPQGFAEDLVLYRFPRAADPEAASATLAITPSRAFTIDELELGRVSLRAQARADAAVVDAGTALLGAAGGEATSAAGDRVAIPPSALAAETPVRLARLGAAQVPASIPAAAGLLAAVALDLGGRELATPALLATPRPATVALGDQVLVAEVVTDPAGVPRLELVGRGAVGAFAVTVEPSLAGRALRGVRRGGVYIFVRPAPALAFVAGVVRTGAGLGAPARAGAVVTTDTAPFAAITDASGAYLVAAGAGASAALGAVDPLTGDAGSAPVTAGAPGTVADVDLAILAVAPRVVRVDPADGATGVALEAAIEVRFSEPVDAPSAALGVTLAVAGSGAPVPTTARVAPDGLSLALTPVAPLASFTRFTVSAAATILDRAGHPLEPFAGATFTTLDATFRRDLAGRVTADAPDANGLVRVRATAGTAEPGAAAAVIDNTTGIVETVVAAADGSFELTIAATAADVLTISVRNAGGTDSQLHLASYRSPDGSVTLGALGGEVSVDTPDGPIILAAPEDAFDQAATVKLTPLTRADVEQELAALGLALPVEDPAAPGFDPAAPLFAGAVRISTTADSRAKVNLSFPLPADVLAKAAPRAAALGLTVADLEGICCRVESYEENGQTIPGFRELDSMKQRGGRLGTASPPFAGLALAAALGATTDAALVMAFLNFGPRYVHGTVFLANDPAEAHPIKVVPGSRGSFVTLQSGATISTADLQALREGLSLTQLLDLERRLAPTAPGTIVRVNPLAGVLNPFYAVTDGAGNFALSTPASATLAFLHPLARDIPSFRAVSAAALPFRAVRIGEDVVLRRRVVIDRTPPRVLLLPDRLTVAVGERISGRIVVTDNDQSQAALDAIDASLEIALRDQGGTQVLSGFPRNGGRHTYSFIAPSTPQQVALVATARDASDPANLGTSPPLRITVVATLPPPPSNTIQAGDPHDATPPTVLRMEPPPGSLVARGAEVRIFFSEAVSPIGADGTEVVVQESVGGDVSAVNGVARLSADARELVFEPTGGFRAGAEVDVLVDARDLLGHRLDQDPFEEGADPFTATLSTVADPKPVDIDAALPFSADASRSMLVAGTTVFYARRDAIGIADVRDPSLLAPPLLVPVSGDVVGLALAPRMRYLDPAGEPTAPRDLLIAVLRKTPDLDDDGAAIDEVFLGFFDVSDPRAPRRIGRDVLVSRGTSASRIVLAGGGAVVAEPGAPPGPVVGPSGARLGPDRAFVKLIASPNPGLAVVDLRLALVKAEHLPAGGSASILPLDGVPEAGLDANADGDFGDPGDALPRVDAETDVVRGRLVTPGDLVDLAVSADGRTVFVADGRAIDRNGEIDTDPFSGFVSRFLGVGHLDAEGRLVADAGGVVVADMTRLEPVPLLDLSGPGEIPDGLDDRVIGRFNKLDAITSRLLLAEGLRYRERLHDGSIVEVERDILFASTNLPSIPSAVVVMLDVTDPTRPLLLDSTDVLVGVPFAAVDLTLRGRRLFVETGLGAFELDIDRMVERDDQGAPRNALNQGVDPTLAGGFAGVATNGAVSPTGHTFGGTHRKAQVALIAPPELEIVRFDGTAAELADFVQATSQPGAELEKIERDLAKLRPVDRVQPGHLHADPSDLDASDPGDREDPACVVFVRARLPFGAAEEGTVTLTLDSLDAAQAPLGSPGVGWAPVRVIDVQLVRQLADAHAESPGARLSDLGTTYISEPIFLALEPLRQADEDLADPDRRRERGEPVVLTSGHFLRAGLEGNPRSTNVGRIYAGLGGEAADAGNPLDHVRATAASLPAEMVDSPEPEPPAERPSPGGPPVLPHSGELHWSATDLAIRGRGLDYAFTRVYQSQLAYVGPLGRGWDFVWNQRLQEILEPVPPELRNAPGQTVSAEDVLFFDGAGRVDAFARAGDGPDAADPDELAERLDLDDDDLVAAHYRSPPGIFARLWKLEDGTFVLIEPSGLQRRFGARGELVAIEDLNGNRLDCVYRDGRLRQIVDTMGRRIAFGYFLDPARAAGGEGGRVEDLDEEDRSGRRHGLIARQRDFIGREVRYEYDEERRLIEVVTPAVAASNDDTDAFPDGKRTRYDYDPAPSRRDPSRSFPLVAVTDASALAAGGPEAPRIRNTFDDQGRVETQVRGDPSTQTVGFTYSGSTTTVTDREGNPTELTYDPERHLARIVQKGQQLPAEGLTTEIAARNADGLVTRVVLPEGNSVEYVYDEGNARRRSQANLLEVTRRPDPEEPDGSRGNGGSSDELVTGYLDYDFVFNRPTRVIDPGGLETRFAYDERGNLEEILHPAATGVVERFAYNDLGQLTHAIDGEGNVTAYEYFPETTPDGEVATDDPGRDLDGGTGGYLKSVTADADHPDREADANAGVGPFTPTDPDQRRPRALVTAFAYDDVSPGAPGIGRAGNPTGITDPRGIRTLRSINERNQVFRVVRAASDATDGSGAPALAVEERFFFDANDRLVRHEAQRDATGATGVRFLVSRLEYDDLTDNLRKRTVTVDTEAGPRDLTTDLDYDAENRLVRLTRPEGNATAYAYDGLGRLRSITRGAGSTEAATTTYAYDQNGNFTRMTDALGSSIHVQYDGYDRQRSVQDRMGNTSRVTEYDDHGLVRKVERRGARSGQGAATPPTDEVLARVEIDYDDLLRRTEVREEIGALAIGGAAVGGGADGVRTTTFTYDQASRLVQVVDDEGHATRTFYDGAGRTIATVDALGNVAEVFYDPNGNAVRTVDTDRVDRDPPAVEVFEASATYDALDRLASTTDALGHTRQFEYDAAGGLTRAIDAEGNVVEHAYDVLGRRVRTRQHLTSPAASFVTTRWAYDGNDRLTRLVDDNGRATDYGPYDALDRLLRTRFADGTAVDVLAYDANGNAREVRDANGHRIESTYDLEDRLVARHVVLGGRARLGDFDAVDETWEYDGLGRVTRAADEDSVCEYDYDSLGRVAHALDRRGATTYVTQGTFDGVGNRRLLAYPSGPVVETGYDDIDRIAEVDAGSVAVADYAYAGRARVASVTLGNGVACAYGYDGDRRLTSVRAEAQPAGQPRPTLFDLRVSFTPEDRRTGEQWLHEGGLVDVFEYDSLQRLVGVERRARSASSSALDALGPNARPTVTGAAIARDYARDGVHNLVTVATPPPPDPRERTGFPDAFGAPSARNQIDALVEGGQPRTQGYDPNGNTLALRLARRDQPGHEPVPEDATVDYDFRNRPIRVTFATTGDTVTYRYDVEGRRIEEAVVRGGGGGGGGAPEVRRFIWDGPRVIEERSGDDQVLRRHIYGAGINDVLAIEVRDAQSPNGAMLLRYLHRSSLGSVVGVTDDAGRELERYRYDPYGEAIIEAADFAPPRVLAIREAAGRLEIDFTEPLAPGDLDGLVELDGQPPAAIELLDAVVAVPSSDPAVAGEAYRATVRVTPATGQVTAGAPLVVTVLPVDATGTRRLADVPGNLLAQAFAEQVTPAGFDGVLFTDPAATGTGPRRLARSAVGNPWLFQGHRLDVETGLYDFRARLYAPQLGRFLQTDPKGYADGPNLYAAFGGDPVNRVDPMGTESEDPMRAYVAAHKALMDAQAAGVHQSDPGRYAELEGAYHAAAGGAQSSIDIPLVRWFAEQTAWEVGTAGVLGGFGKAAKAIGSYLGIGRGALATSARQSVSRLRARVSPLERELQSAERLTSGLALDGPMPSSWAAIQQARRRFGSPPAVGEVRAAGKLSDDAIHEQLDALTYLHGREFGALRQAGTGEVALVSGSRGSVPLFGRGSWQPVAHSHPWSGGYSSMPSRADLSWLRGQFQQGFTGRSLRSTIVARGEGVVHFNTGGSVFGRGGRPLDHIDRAPSAWAAWLSSATAPSPAAYGALRAGGLSASGWDWDPDIEVVPLATEGGR